MAAAATQHRSLALTAAIAASILLHAALAGFLLRYLNAIPTFPPPEIMTVELVPWFADRKPPPRPPDRPPANAPRSSSPDVLTRPTDAALAPDAAPVPLAPAVLDPGVRQALRGLMGCDRLPRDEREACQERIAARRHDPAPRLNLDPGTRFAETPEAYVNRKPKNGCKLRAAGDPGLHGKDGARAAFSCAWDF